MTEEQQDQAAHFAAGFLIVAMANLLGANIGPGSGAFIALACGITREITEEGRITLAAFLHIIRGEGSRRDLIFWTLGGAVAGLIARII